MKRGRPRHRLSPATREVGRFFAPAGSVAASVAQMVPDLTDGGIEALIEAAKAHGEQSEPDMEVGDLQQIVRSCWSRLTVRAKREVMDEHRDLIAEWRAGS